MVRFVTFIIIFFMYVQMIYGQFVKVEITGIRTDQGILLVSLFENQEQFKSDQPVIIKKVAKAALRDSTLIVEFKNLTPQYYGIAVLDDENENGEMDYRLKRPTEGFGFSNYWHKGLFRPKFEDFSFELGEKDVVVKVVMRYIKEAE